MDNSSRFFKGHSSLRRDIPPLKKNKQCFLISQHGCSVLIHRACSFCLYVYVVAVLSLGKSNLTRGSCVGVNSCPSMFVFHTALRETGDLPRL